MSFRDFFSFVKSNQDVALNEGIYDTSTYKRMQQRYKFDGPMSPGEYEETMNILSTPDARPGLFDGTLEAWLLRISLWGKIKITHKNPENRIVRSMTEDQFLDYIDDQTRNASYGKWTVEEVEINKIRYYRKFWSIYGKEVTEELIVDIDLRPDLKKKINQARRKLGIFGR
jgi:tRNA-dihydrouridine synthase